MRRRNVLLTAAVTTLLAAGTANAAVLFELELIGSPGVTSAAPGTNIEIGVFMTPGSEGITIFAYDLVSTSGVAVAASNESIVLGAGPNCPTTAFSNCNMSQLTSPTLYGNTINYLNLYTLNIGPTGGRYLIATTLWNFTGPDVVSVSVTSDPLDNALPANVVPVNTTTFTIVPEPGTAWLLALGLGGLSLAGRRRREARRRG